MLKKICTGAAALIMYISTLSAQTPDAFNYQAMVRDNNGNIVANQNVSFRISIIETTVDGAAVYTETHATTTSAQGVVTLQIGNGDVVSGDFGAIQWGSDIFFARIEADITGGTDYVTLGTTQLLSVPYALHAKTVDASSLIWSKNGGNVNYNGGNVGIGTTSPENKLEIIGDGTNFYTPLVIKNNASAAMINEIYSDVDFNHGGISIKRARGTINSPTDVQPGDRIGGIYAGEYLDNDFQASSSIEMYASEGVGTGSYPSSIRFLTTAVNNIEREERMRIAEDGNVGIGTSTPKSKLQVSSGDVYLDQVGTGVIMKSPDEQCWRLSVDNSGNPSFQSVTCPE